jgi:hypothetical protein
MLAVGTYANVKSQPAARTVNSTHGLGRAVGVDGAHFFFFHGPFSLQEKRAPGCLIAGFYLVDRGLRHRLPEFSSMGRLVILP